MKSRVSYYLMSQNTPNRTGYTVLSNNWQCCRKTLASGLMQYTGLFLWSLFCFNFFPDSMETSNGRNSIGIWFKSVLACGEKHWQRWVVSLKGWKSESEIEKRNTDDDDDKKDSLFYVLLHCWEPPQTGSHCFSFPPCVASADKGWRLRSPVCITGVRWMTSALFLCFSVAKCEQIWVAGLHILISILHCS